MRCCCHIPHEKPGNDVLGRLNDTRWIMVQPRTLGPALAYVVEELELTQPVLVDLAQIERILEARGCTHRLPRWPAGCVCTGGCSGHSSAECSSSRPERTPARLGTETPSSTFAPGSITTTRPAGQPSTPADSTSSRSACTAPSGCRAGLTAPTDVRGWSIILEALPDLVAATTAQSLGRELKDSTSATRARLGYLLDGQDTGHLHLEQQRVQPSEGTTWFGPRQPGSHFDARWNIADSVPCLSADRRAPCPCPSVPVRAPRAPPRGIAAITSSTTGSAGP